MIKRFKNMQSIHQDSDWKASECYFASATVILYLYKERSRNLSHYNSRRRLIRRCLVDLVIISALMSRQYLRNIFHKTRPQFFPSVDPHFCY